ncbi:MAG TPA: GNAT family N-acetyltransferase [Actinomycetota bacterium]|nr:GNAT family N-acetyltransferase [Actinomycetota bacterium]
MRERHDPGAEVTLRDGSVVQVRPVRTNDAAAVRCLFQQLSETSRWLRFFSDCVNLDCAVAWATDIDGYRRDGLLVLAGDNGPIVAHAGFERDERHPDRAEFAIVIADSYQGRGLGAILLARLVDVADRAGVRTFVGEVLPDNYRMLRMLSRSGLEVSFHRAPGVVLVEIPTSHHRQADMVSAA